MAAGHPGCPAAGGAIRDRGRMDCRLLPSCCCAPPTLRPCGYWQSGRRSDAVPRAVSMLIAAICLVDALAVALYGGGILLACFLRERLPPDATFPGNHSGDVMQAEPGSSGLNGSGRAAMVVCDGFIALADDWIAKSSECERHVLVPRDCRSRQARPSRRCACHCDRSCARRLGKADLALTTDDRARADSLATRPRSQRLERRPGGADRFHGRELCRRRRRLRGMVRQLLRHGRPQRADRALPWIAGLPRGRQ